MAARLPLDVVLGVVDKATRPMSRFAAGVAKVGQGIKRAGRGMTRTATVPLLAIGAIAGTTAAQYEFAMNRVRALTGAQGEAFEKLSGQAKELGRSTIFSAQQAAEAQGNLALAGFKTNEIFSATPGVLAAAAATNTDLGETAGIVSETLRGYSIAAADVARVSNVLTVASTSANQRLTDLGESMTFAGPIAAGFNMEFEEAVALASRFADAGFSGSLGGTALKNALLELGKIVRKPTGRPFQVLEELGIDPRTIFTAEGNVRDLLGLIDSLRGAGASGLDLGEIFGKRTIGPLMRLANSGAGSVRELAEELRNSGGEADRLAAIMNSGAFGAMQRLKAAAEGVMIAIGESGLLTALEKNADRLSAWLQGIAETSPEVLNLALKVAALTALLGPLLLTVGQAMLIFSGFTNAVIFLSPWVAKLGVALWTKAIPAVWGFTAALLANPFTWIILGFAAVIAATVAFATDLGGIRTKILGLFSDLWLGIRTAGKAIWSWLTGIPRRIMEALSGAFSWVQDKVSALVEWLPDWLVGAGEGKLAVEVNGRSTARSPDPAFASGGPRGGPGTPARVVVDFSELPRGARVRSDSGDADLDLGVGFAHDGPLG